MLDVLVALYKSLQQLLTLPQVILNELERFIFSSEETQEHDSEKDVVVENVAFKELFDQSQPFQKALPTVDFSKRSEPFLVNDGDSLSNSTLKRFTPLRYLIDADLSQISYKTMHYHVNSVIFVTRQRTDYIYYLLQGKVELRPEGALAYEVMFGSPQAILPLNSGYVCAASAITTMPSIILAVSRIFLQRISQRKYRYTGNNDFVKTVLPRELPNNQFFANFAYAYRENMLTLPTLPQVAFRLKKALENPDITIPEIVNIVQFDASIVAKLIQVANSVFYAAESPITNCHHAVIRLGLDATRRVVMGITVKQMFRCQHLELKGLMETNWRNSIYLSSLCFVLAKESKTVNPEDALLAGLISDIGRIPVLNFAEQQPEPPNLMELKSSLPFLSPPVGALMLYNLGFSPELVNIPRFSEDWFYESGDENLTVTDIVILAKLHGYFGSRKAKYLPLPNTVPAYAKLSDSKLNADFSLNVLNQAKERIFEAMTFFV